jgi:hypothetical protein
LSSGCDSEMSLKPSLMYHNILSSLIGEFICAPAMKIGCIMQLAIERASGAFEQKRLSRRRVARKEFTRLWVLINMLTNRLVDFEDIAAEEV